MKRPQKNEKAVKEKVVTQRSLPQQIKYVLIRNWQLYLMLAIPVAYIFVFNYIPMYGAQIAFREYKVSQGIWGSEWVGLEHFIRFLNSTSFKTLMVNTLGISVYAIIVGMPFPILLAIMLKYIPWPRYSKLVQTVTYAPHFISVVVMSGIIIDVLNPRSGMIHNLLALIGIDFSINLLGIEAAFSSVFVWSGVWQAMGFSAIIYTAILAGVDVSLHEAAMVDGATILQRIRFIDFPSLVPQITLSLILSVGNVLNVGFEKALLLQNDLNTGTSEIIDTYVYKMGIASSFPDVSYTTAIGLTKSIIAFILIVIANKVARTYGEMSLW
ncbi:MAG: ABC transporter permease subunit [Lachnospiraceae bacterium]